MIREVLRKCSPFSISMSAHRTSHPVFFSSRVQCIILSLHAECVKRPKPPLCDSLAHVRLILKHLFYDCYLTSSWHVFLRINRRNHCGLSLGDLYFPDGLHCKPSMRKENLNPFTVGGRICQSTDWQLKPLRLTHNRLRLIQDVPWFFYVYYNLWAEGLLLQDEKNKMNKRNVLSGPVQKAGKGTSLLHPGF